MRLNVDQLPSPSRADFNATLLIRLRSIVDQINGVSEGRLAPLHSAMTAAPTTGAYALGDFVPNKNRGVLLSGGQATLMGWVCSSESPLAFLEVQGATSTTVYCPAGLVGHFAMNAAPAGWLKANGATISRTTYAGLFAAIGTSFGVGDGSTTFAIPDLRGEFARGWDDGRGIDAARVFGSAQAQGTQTHQHRLPIGFDGTLFYGWGDGSSAPVFGSDVQTAAQRLQAGNTNTASSPVRVGLSDSPLLNAAGETRPRNVALLACIKY